MAVAHVSSSLYLSLGDVRTAANSTRSGALPQLPLSNRTPTLTSSIRGSVLLISVVMRTSSGRKHQARAASLSVRCEQSTKEGGGLDVWLGRLAMIGFAVGIGVEVTTGRGVLENFGLATPLPTVALAVTGLVGVLTAVFIFQSASKD